MEADFFQIWFLLTFSNQLLFVIVVLKYDLEKVIFYSVVQGDSLTTRCGLVVGYHTCSVGSISRSNPDKNVSINLVLPTEANFEVSELR